MNREQLKEYLVNHAYHAGPSSDEVDYEVVDRGDDLPITVACVRYGTDGAVRLLLLQAQHDWSPDPTVNVIEFDGASAAAVSAFVCASRNAAQSMGVTPALVVHELIEEAGSGRVFRACPWSPGRACGSAKCQPRPCSGAPRSGEVIATLGSRFAVPRCELLRGDWVGAPGNSDLEGLPGRRQVPSESAETSGGCGGDLLQDEGEDLVEFQPERLGGRK